MTDSKGPGPSQPPSRAVEESTPDSPAATTPAAKPMANLATNPTGQAKPEPAGDKPLPAPPSRKPEIGGPKGPEPTRYGDWEKGGRCIDF